MCIKKISPRQGIVKKITRERLVFVLTTFAEENKNKHKEKQNINWDSYHGLGWKVSPVGKVMKKA